MLADDGGKGVQCADLNDSKKVWSSSLILILYMRAWHEKKNEKEQEERQNCV